ncbi:MAG: CHAT domain-containing protein [Cyanobacteria bacterium P01_F01_bin.53]
MNPIKILILTANPKISGHSPLRVDAEVRLVEEAIQRSQYRDRFQVTTKLAIRPTDLRRALLDHRPQIVHFSGHGSGEHGLVLETDTGKQNMVSNEAITGLFGIFEMGEIECVLLNACYSEVQANTIHQFVDCVIGMNQAVGDKAAVQFAEGFYDALGAGSPYDEAFKIGRSAIALSGSSDTSIPVLKYRKRPGTVSPAEQAATDDDSASEDSVPVAPPTPPSQSQSIGNVTISGSNNPFNAVQAGGDVTINQSQTQAKVSNPNLQAALAAIEQLKQAIAANTEMDDTDKAMAAIPMQKLEAELQKSQPNPAVIDKMIATLKKALDDVVTLAAPVNKVATLVAQARAAIS